MQPSAVMPLLSRQVADGLKIAKVTAEALGEPLDPFLMCDCFEMAQPFFPPHPHAGFSAVTYILPESEGGFVNRDSLGDKSLIRPGGVHWTEAARGVMHEEVPIVRGQVVRGLQIFVNLPAVHKLGAPRIYHAEPESIPVWSEGDASVRVLAGSLEQVRSVVQPRTDCAIWDVTVRGGGSARLPVPTDWRVFGVVTDGALAQHGPTGLAAVRLHPEGGAVQLTAADIGARVVLLAGRPLNEPLALDGPFVMSTREQLLDAKRRFVNGEMGHLQPSF